MDASILCTLIAKQVPPAQFQLHGLSVHWMSPDYDTPENAAIVADVIANYDTLAATVITEEKAADVRRQRDVRLRCSDCKLIEDHPTQKKQEWKTYRQALRDVPGQPGFPDAVTWPEMPE